METKNLKEKLSLIQNELKAPKNQYNSFGKYKYRNCEDILEAVKPLCQKNRTTLIIKDEIVVQSDRVYVKAIARLEDWDSEMCIETSALARESETKTGMDVAQITGASSSYARKYALNGLFNIDDTKDSDTEEYQDKTAKQNKGTQKGANNATSKVNDEQNQKQTLVEEIGLFYSRNPGFKEILLPALRNRKTNNVGELPLQDLEGLVSVIRASENKN